MKLAHSSLLALAVLAACQKAPKTEPLGREESVQAYSKPVFSDSATFSRMSAAFPVIDKIFHDYAVQHHFAGLAFGIIAGDTLVYAGSYGVTDVDQQTPVTARSLFRIASMSKSFTAMAILKLRDEGKLRLSDPASNYIPELHAAGKLTHDAGPITVQNLLTMSAGFPEDNPWGDRQLEDKDEELLQLLREGISFSNVPGTTFEYSNLGFALLGKIITNVTGEPYQQYITEHILTPLRMTSSRYEYAEVPAGQLALGYDWTDSTWASIPLLHDGAYGAMGGMICSIEDFSKYVAFHLAAWPPRNGADDGPVKRSTVREMHQPWRFGDVYADAKNRRGENCPVATGYGYGLGWRKDCRGIVRVSHSGGLPGFGSEWRIYPDYGIGVVSFSNQTYGAPGMPNAIALDTLIQLAGLKPRVLPPSKVLTTRKDQLLKILPAWADTTAHRVFAENFFMDQSLERWKKTTAEVFQAAGAIQSTGDVIPENQLRGTFTLTGEKKNIAIFFTLTPEAGARIQELSIELVEKTQPSGARQ
jgi:CubicO group peptidase (beta-lactamase class C family)